MTTPAPSSTKIVAKNGVFGPWTATTFCRHPRHTDSLGKHIVSQFGQRIV